MNEHMSLWERKPHLHPSIHSSIHPSIHPYTHNTTYWLRVQALGDFPGDLAVNAMLMLSNAKGASLISGWGTKTPPVSGQLNLHIAMTETLCVMTKIPHTATKTQGSQKKKKSYNDSRLGIRQTWVWILPLALTVWPFSFPTGKMFMGLLWALNITNRDLPQYLACTKCSLIYQLLIFGEMQPSRS